MGLELQLYKSLDMLINNILYQSEKLTAFDISCSWLYTKTEKKNKRISVKS